MERKMKEMEDKISRGEILYSSYSSNEQEETIRQSNDVDKSRGEGDVFESPLTTKMQKGKRKLRSSQVDK
ncbi:hypothetical protein R1flu_020447 [Riccia fluitans]|uniref:Uncharacterized protein n=1 Tax=Riccia fluitans TaxID=41844 RepID=A0ABD1ZLI8_9MARC